MDSEQNPLSTKAQDTQPTPTPVEPTQVSKESTEQAENGQVSQIPSNPKPTTDESPPVPNTLEDTTAVLDPSSENKDIAETDMGPKASHEDLDEAFGHAADSLWNLASAVTGSVSNTVSNVVKGNKPDLENFRRNVTNTLAPLDTFGRDLSSQIGALAPKEAALSTITGSMKSVAETMQRNAEAMENAIIAKANETERDTYVKSENGEEVLTRQANSEVIMADPAVGLLALEDKNDKKTPEVEIDVNEEIAKVGETIQNSIIGQTVGGIWTGLWGGGEEAIEQPQVLVPKTRFEKRIFELQGNPDTYCEPAKDLDAFAVWSKGFNLDDNADSCIAILDTHDAIADLYERVVPRIVDEDTFWMRYFFAKSVLEKEEERRKKLLERAENVGAEGDEEDGWGDDDWGDADEDVTKQQKENMDGKADDAGSKTVDKSADLEVKDEKQADAKAESNKPNVSEEKGTADDKEDDDWGDDDWE